MTVVHGKFGERGGRQSTKTHTTTSTKTHFLCQQQRPQPVMNSNMNYGLSLTVQDEASVQAHMKIDNLQKRARVAGEEYYDRGPAKRAVKGWMDLPEGHALKKREKKKRSAYVSREATKVYESLLADYVKQIENECTEKRNEILAETEERRHMIAEIQRLEALKAKTNPNAIDHMRAAAEVEQYVPHRATSSQEPFLLSQQHPVEAKVEYSFASEFELSMGESSATTDGALEEDPLNLVLGESGVVQKPGPYTTDNSMYTGTNVHCDDLFFSTMCA